MTDYSKTNAAYFRQFQALLEFNGRYVYVNARAFALRTWRDFRWSMIAREYEAGNLVCRIIEKDQRILRKGTSYWIARVVREAKAAKKGKTNG